MSLTVDLVPFAAADHWDSFVQTCDGWTAYHLYGWRRVIEDVYGHECLYLGANNTEGVLEGILPLVRVRSRVFGHFLVSMPFLNYGGPIGTPAAVLELSRRAVALADQGNADLLELRSSHELPIDLPVSHRKITVLLDLPTTDAEPLWNGLRPKVRSQVRRPMKEGVEVRFGPDEVDGFYSVFRRHMRDLGTPVKPKAFFESVRREFPDRIWFACAFLQGRPIASGCGFRWSDRFELVWAAALREHNRIAPNMLLYWRIIERCVADGARVFDFGRCTPGGGTHKFKAQWGGRDQQLWWYQHGSNEGGGTPSPQSGRYALGPKVWSKLPMSVANALGPRIVKFIP